MGGTRPTVPASEYPIRVNWLGVAVDDTGHANDVGGEDAAHEIIWNDRADAVERETCELLAAKTLRDYFRKPAGFFADHLKRYSKSRRQAPIYWPLSTASGSYTLWIYYHRLTDQTLYKCVNDFVEPKLKQVAGEAARLRQKASRSSARRRNGAAERPGVGVEGIPRRVVAAGQVLEAELERRRADHRRPAVEAVPASPVAEEAEGNLGVAGGRRVRLGALAYSIWPDRVRDKCRTDKSLAIAHGLEELYQEPEKPVKKKRGKKK